MLLFWPVVIPFVTAALTLLAAGRRRVQRAISLAGALGLLASGAAVLTRVLAEGPVAAQAGGWPAPFGITFVADLLSAALVTLAGAVAVAVLVVARAGVTEAEERDGYHALTHAMLAGVCGAFLTGDLFNLYVWFEVMLIASFGLLVIGGGRAQLDGAVKYAGLNLIGTVAFIAGVGLLYGATGALNMADLHVRLLGRAAETPVLASAALLIFAFGAKAALFPLFFWLPASYHTPAFPTAGLLAALSTKVGVYALVRVFTLVYPLQGTPIQPLLLWGAVLSMVVGALGALTQTTMRRVFGFGIVSSMGYVVLGLAVATPLAMLASVYYLLQDVVVKASLFLGAGLVARVAGSEAFASTGGMWRARPWLSTLFLLPALSFAGTPPLPGFWAKLALTQATLEIGGYGLTLAVLGTGLLTLYAMARIWASAFWAPHPLVDRIGAKPAPGVMIAPLAALAALVVMLGAFAGPFLGAAGEIAAGLLDPVAYLGAVGADTQ